MIFLKPYEKFVAGLVVVCFLATSATPLPAAEAPVSISPSFIPMGIPAELASIEEVFLPKSGGDNVSPLIHIQSVHAHAETQRKIYSLLKFLDEKYGVQSLFIEGAAENLDPAYFQFFDDNRLNIRVAEKLIDKGELTGAELFLVETEKKIPAYGIEDPSLYQDNLSSFQSVMTSREVTGSFTRDLRGVLDRMETLLLEPEARRLLRSSESFDAGRLQLLSYLFELERSAKTVLGLDLRRFESQVEWPQLIRLFRLQEIESKLEPEKIQSDRERLTSSLKDLGVESSLVEAFQNLSFSPYQSGMVYNPGFHKNDLPRYLAERLVLSTKEKGFTFKQYPYFTRYLEASILQSELEADRLFGEIEKLHENLVRTLSPGEEDWKLVESVRSERLLERLFDLELTPKDYSKIRDFNREQRPLVRFLLEIESLQKSAHLKIQRVGREDLPYEIVPKNIGEIESVYGQAVRFYQLAKEREETMAEKILASSSSGERAGVRGVSVLITGGFHKEGLSRVFREKQIPYTVLTPRITEKVSPEAYISSLLGEKKTAFDTQYLEAVVKAQQMLQIKMKMYPSKRRERMARAEILTVIEAIAKALEESARKGDIVLPVGRVAAQLSGEGKPYFPAFPFALHLNETGDGLIPLVDFDGDGKAEEPLTNRFGKTFTIGTMGVELKVPAAVARFSVFERRPLPLPPPAKPKAVPSRAEVRASRALDPEKIKQRYQTLVKTVSENDDLSAQPDRQEPVLRAMKTDILIDVETGRWFDAAQRLRIMRDEVLKIFVPGGAPQTAQEILESILTVTRSQKKLILSFKTLALDMERLSIPKELLELVKKGGPEEKFDHLTKQLYGFSMENLLIDRISRFPGSVSDLSDELDWIPGVPLTRRDQMKTVILNAKKKEILISVLLHELRIEKNPDLERDREIFKWGYRLGDVGLAAIIHHFAMLPRAEVRSEKKELNGGKAFRAAGQANPKMSRPQLRATGTKLLRRPSMDRPFHPPLTINPENQGVRTRSQYTTQPQSGQGTTGIENQSRKGNRQEAQKGPSRILPLLKGQFKHDENTINNMKNSQVLISGPRAEVRSDVPLDKGQLENYAAGKQGLLLLQLLMEHFQVTPEILAEEIVTDPSEVEKWLSGEEPPKPVMISWISDYFVKRARKEASGLELVIKKSIEEAFSYQGVFGKTGRDERKTVGKGVIVKLIEKYQDQTRGKNLTASQAASFIAETQEAKEAGAKKGSIYQYFIKHPDLMEQYGISSQPRAEVRSAEGEAMPEEEIYPPPAATPKTIGTVLEIFRLLSQDQLKPGPETEKKVHKWVEAFAQANPDINASQVEAIGLIVLRTIERFPESKRSGLFSELVQGLNGPDAVVRIRLMQWWAQYFAFYLDSLKEKSYKTGFAFQDQNLLLSFAEAVDSKLADLFQELIESDTIWPTRWAKTPWWKRVLWITVGVALFPIAVSVFVIGVLLNTFRRPQGEEPKTADKESLNVAFNRFFIPTGLFVRFQPRKIPDHYDLVLYKTSHPKYLKSVSARNKVGWLLQGKKVVAPPGFELAGAYFKESNIIILDLDSTEGEAHGMALALRPDLFPDTEAYLKAKERALKHLKEIFSKPLRERGVIEKFDPKDVEIVDEFDHRLSRKAYEPYALSADSGTDAIVKIAGAMAEHSFFHEAYHLGSHLLNLRVRYKESEEELMSHLFQLITSWRYPTSVYHSLSTHISHIAMTSPVEAFEKEGFEGVYPGYEEIIPISSEILDALIPGKPRIASQPDAVSRVHALAQKIPHVDLDRLTVDVIAERAYQLVHKRYGEDNPFVAMGPISAGRSLGDVLESYEGQPPYALKPYQPSELAESLPPQAERSMGQLIVETAELKTDDDVFSTVQKLNFAIGKLNQEGEISTLFHASTAPEDEVVFHHMGEELGRASMIDQTKLIEQLNQIFHRAEVRATGLRDLREGIEAIKIDLNVTPLTKKKISDFFNQFSDKTPFLSRNDPKINGILITDQPRQGFWERLKGGKKKDEMGFDRERGRFALRLETDKFGGVDEKILFQKLGVFVREFPRLVREAGYLTDQELSEYLTAHPVTGAIDPRVGTFVASDVLVFNNVFHKVRLLENIHGRAPLEYIQDHVRKVAGGEKPISEGFREDFRGAILAAWWVVGVVDAGSTPEAQQHYEERRKVSLLVMELLEKVLIGKEREDLETLKQWASVDPQGFIASLKKIETFTGIALSHYSLVDKSLLKKLKHERLHGELYPILHKPGSQKEQMNREILVAGLKSFLKLAGFETLWDLFGKVAEDEHSPYQAMLVALKQGDFSSPFVDEFWVHTLYPSGMALDREKELKNFQYFLTELERLNPDFKKAMDLMRTLQKTSDSKAEKDLEALEKYAGPSEQETTVPKIFPTGGVNYVRVDARTLMEKVWQTLTQNTRAIFKRLRDAAGYKISDAAIESGGYDFDPQIKAKIEHAGIFRDASEGSLWILKKRESAAARQSKRPGDWTSPEREMLSYRLLSLYSNQAAIRFLTPADQGLPREVQARPGDYFLVRLVIEGKTSEGGLAPADFPSKDSSSAFSSLLVAHTLFGKTDPTLANLGYVQGVPVAYDNSQILLYDQFLTHEGHLRFFQAFYIFQALFDNLYNLTRSQDFNYKNWYRESTVLMGQDPDIHDPDPRKQEAAMARGYKKILLKIQRTLADKGLDEAFWRFYGLDLEQIRKSIRDFKTISEAQIRESAQAAGYAPGKPGYDLDGIVRFILENQKSLGRDVNELLQFLTGRDHQLDKLDQDFSASRAEVREAGRVLLPLKLAAGKVEREAVYEADKNFWGAVEKSNPGTWERAAKIIATYPDSTDQPLTQGQDYDAFINRSARIHLKNPISFHGVLFRELILNGALFTKKGRQIYDRQKEAGEDSPVFHPEFDEQGMIQPKRIELERFGALRSSEAEREYFAGLHAFHSQKAPVFQLPVLLVQYTQEKEPDQEPLGLVVIASPFIRDAAATNVLDEDSTFEVRAATFVNELIRQVREGQFDEYEALKRVSDFYRGQGEALAAFHQAGFTHGNPHPDNLIYDPAKKKSGLTDLEDARLKTRMTKEQAFGYQFRDVLYALTVLVSAAEKYAAEQEETFLGYVSHLSVVGFLTGYFGEKQLEKKIPSLKIDSEKLMDNFKAAVQTSARDQTPIYNVSNLMLDLIREQFDGSWKDAKELLPGNIYVHQNTGERHFIEGAAPDKLGWRVRNIDSGETFGLPKERLNIFLREHRLLEWGETSRAEVRATTAFSPEQFEQAYQKIKEEKGRAPTIPELGRELPAKAVHTVRTYVKNLAEEGRAPKITSSLTGPRMGWKEALKDKPSAKAKPELPSLGPRKQKRPAKPLAEEKIIALKRKVREFQDLMQHSTKTEKPVFLIYARRVIGILSRLERRGALSGEDSLRPQVVLENLRRAARTYRRFNKLLKKEQMPDYREYLKIYNALRVLTHHRAEVRAGWPEPPSALELEERRGIRSGLNLRPVVEAFQSLLKESPKTPINLATFQPQDAYIFNADGRIEIQRLLHERPQVIAKKEGGIPEGVAQIMKRAKVEKIEIIHGELPAGDGEASGFANVSFLTSLVEDLLIDLDPDLHAKRPITMMLSDYLWEEGLGSRLGRFPVHPLSGRGHNLLGYQVSFKPPNHIRLILGPYSGMVLRSPEAFDDFRAAMQKRALIGDFQSQIDNPPPPAPNIISYPFWHLDRTTGGLKRGRVILQRTGLDGFVIGENVEGLPSVQVMLTPASLTIKRGGKKIATIPALRPLVAIGHSAIDDRFHIFLNEKPYQALQSAMSENGLQFFGFTFDSASPRAEVRSSLGKSDAESLRDVISAVNPDLGKALNEVQLKSLLSYTKGLALDFGSAEMILERNPQTQSLSTEETIEQLQSIFASLTEARSLKVAIGRLLPAVISKIDTYAHLLMQLTQERVQFDKDFDEALTKIENNQVLLNKLSPKKRGEWFSVLDEVVKTLEDSRKFVAETNDWIHQIEDRVDKAHAVQRNVINPGQLTVAKNELERTLSQLDVLTGSLKEKREDFHKAWQRFYELRDEILRSEVQAGVIKKPSPEELAKAYKVFFDNPARNEKGEWLRDRWVRVAASMQKAAGFNQNWTRTTEEIVEVNFNGQRVVFDKDALRAAEVWFAGEDKELEERFRQPFEEPFTAQYERIAHFVAEPIEGGFHIKNLIRLGSYAISPALSAYGSVDTETQQGTLRIGNAIFNKEAEKIIFPWGPYVPELETAPPEGKVLIPVHSHPDWSKYKEGPSKGDRDLIKPNNFELVYLMKNKKFVVFDKTGNQMDVPSYRAEVRAAEEEKPLPVYIGPISVMLAQKITERTGIPGARFMTEEELWNFAGSTVETETDERHLPGAGKRKIAKIDPEKLLAEIRRYRPTGGRVVLVYDYAHAQTPYIDPAIKKLEEAGYTVTALQFDAETMRDPKDWDEELEKLILEELDYHFPPGESRAEVRAGPRVDLLTTQGLELSGSETARKGLAAREALAALKEFVARHQETLTKINYFEPERFEPGEDDRDLLGIRRWNLVSIEPKDIGKLSSLIANLNEDPTVILSGHLELGGAPLKFRVSIVSRNGQPKEAWFEPVLDHKIDDLILNGVARAADSYRYKFRKRHEPVPTVSNLKEWIRRGAYAQMSHVLDVIDSARDPLENLEGGNDEARAFDKLRSALSGLYDPIANRPASPPGLRPYRAGGRAEVRAGEGEEELRKFLADLKAITQRVGGDWVKEAQSVLNQLWLRLPKLPFTEKEISPIDPIETGDVLRMKVGQATLSEEGGKQIVTWPEEGAPVEIITLLVLGPDPDNPDKILLLPPTGDPKYLVREEKQDIVSPVYRKIIPTAYRLPLLLPPPKPAQNARELLESLKARAEEIKQQYPNTVGNEIFGLTQEAVEQLLMLFNLKGQTQFESIGSVEDLKPGDVLASETRLGERVPRGFAALVINPDWRKNIALVLDSNGTLEDRMSKQELLRLYPQRIVPRAEVRTGEDATWQEFWQNVRGKTKEAEKIEDVYVRFWRDYFQSWKNRKPDARILEIGSGAPLRFLRLAKETVPSLQITGIDVVKPYEKVPEGIDFRQMSAEAMAFGDDFFDALIGTHTLEFTAFERTLAESFRVLKPGGEAVFVVQHFLKPAVQKMSREVEQIEQIEQLGIFQKAIAALTKNPNKRKNARRNFQDGFQKITGKTPEVFLREVKQNPASASYPDRLLGNLWYWITEPQMAEQAESLIYFHERVMKQNVSHWSRFVQVANDWKDVEIIRARIIGAGFETVTVEEMRDEKMEPAGWLVRAQKPSAARAEVRASKDIIDKWSDYFQIGRLGYEAEGDQVEEAVHGILIPAVVEAAGRVGEKGGAIPILSVGDGFMATARILAQRLEPSSRFPITVVEPAISATTFGKSRLAASFSQIRHVSKPIESVQKEEIGQPPKIVYASLAFEYTNRDKTLEVLKRLAPGAKFVFALHDEGSEIAKSIRFQFEAFKLSMKFLQSIQELIEKKISKAEYQKRVEGFFPSMSKDLREATKEYHQRAMEQLFMGEEMLRADLQEKMRVTAGLYRDYVSRYAPFETKGDPSFREWFNESEFPREEREELEHHFGTVFKSKEEIREYFESRGFRINSIQQHNLLGRPGFYLVEFEPTPERAEVRIAAGMKAGQTLLLDESQISKLRARTRAVTDAGIIETGRIPDAIRSRSTAPMPTPGISGQQLWGSLVTGEFPIPPPVLITLQNIVAARPYAAGVAAEKVMQAAVEVATKVPEKYPIWSIEDVKNPAVWEVLKAVSEVYLEQGIPFNELALKVLTQEGALSAKPRAGALMAKAKSRALTTPGASVMIFNRLLTPSELRAAVISTILNPVLQEIIFAPGVVTAENQKDFEALQEEARHFVPDGRVNIFYAKDQADFDELLRTMAGRLHSRAAQVLGTSASAEDFKEHILVNVEKELWETLSLAGRIEEKIQRALYNFRLKEPLILAQGSFLSVTLILDVLPDTEKGKIRVGPGNYLVEEDDFSGSPYLEALVNAVKNLLELSYSA